MKVLLLEDDEDKEMRIVAALEEFDSNIEVTKVKNWYDYSSQIQSKPYDLILLDLLVPRSSKDPHVEDHCYQLIDTTRSPESKSFRTPAIVLTKYLEQSEEFYKELNKVDINVISFDDENDWKNALRLKLMAARPRITFQFVVLCALSEEMDGFKDVVDSWSPLKELNGLTCREVQIGNYRGAIILLPRMGLVTSAVIAMLAIERFEPRLICTSGICGGIPNNSSIYDVLITDVCHQHDVGKWTDSGFRAEHYDVQINSKIRNKLVEFVASDSVKEYMSNGISLNKFEFPEGKDSFSFRLNIGPTSSGSAVLAEQGKTASLLDGQRKMIGFDMEVFSVFEAARLNDRQPNFFSAKCVVDDGDVNKGDRFHRVGCLLSARFVAKVIELGIVDS